MSLFTNKSPLIPEIIQWHGQWRGEKTALIFNNQHTSWKQFDRITSQIANDLIERGIKQGSRVVVLMENSSNMMSSIFGIIKAGATVVPLNLSISDEAVAVLVNDCHADAIIASSLQANRVDSLIDSSQLDADRLLIVDRGGDMTEIRMVNDESAVSDQSCERWITLHSVMANTNDKLPVVSIKDNDECNIIYSSGTTGMPKGIVHGHRARLDWGYDLALALRYNSDSRVICPLGLYSNVTWVSILSSIVVGGCMIIQEKFSAAEFIQLVRQNKATHCSGVPVLYQRILESDAADLQRLSSLETVMCCGSPLGETLKEQISEDMGCDLIELYGLTEGVITTLAPEDRLLKGKSVGKPLVGTQIRILTDENQFAAAGEVGEIISRGRILMRGYLGRPEADLESSWKDPSGNVWLRTGDIGRIDSEGFIYLVDRKKDMIISGGQNIYPQDLEKVLLQHEAVSEAAVIGVASDKWGETPLGIVVPDSTAGVPSPDEICDWANAKLGKQQKISRLVIATDLPRNANGKVEKKLLRAQYN